MMKVREREEEKAQAKHRVSWWGGVPTSPTHFKTSVCLSACWRIGVVVDAVTYSRLTHLTKCIRSPLRGLMG